MKLYETTFIVDSILKADDISELRDRVVSFVTNHGGEIVKIEEWGKRRLAYEINKKQYGYYIHLRFNAPPAVTGLLEKEYKLNESIMRHLTVEVDPRALKQEQLDRESQQRLQDAEDNRSDSKDDTSDETDTSEDEEELVEEKAA